MDGILSLYDNDAELIEPQTPTCRGLGGIVISKILLNYQKKFFTLILVSLFSPAIKILHNQYSVRNIYHKIASDKGYDKSDKDRLVREKVKVKRNLAHFFFSSFQQLFINHACNY